jgi:alpha-D-xyloside xylohydrolase
MCPFMQLHGRGNLTPWTVTPNTDETVSTYRYWAKLHHALVPFNYSLALEAYAGAPVPMQPIGALADWTHDYRYVLGDTFLVAPILDDTGIRDVQLPAGSRWIDWWTNAATDGGTLISNYDSSDRSRIPLFVKEGSVIPVEVTDDVNGLGSTSSAGKLTVLAWPGTTKKTFTLHEDKDAGTIELSAVRDATSTTVTVSRNVSGVVARIWVEARVVTAVAGLTKHTSRAAFDAASEGWFVDGPFVWVRSPSATTFTLSH